MKKQRVKNKLISSVVAFSVLFGCVQPLFATGPTDAEITISNANQAKLDVFVAFSELAAAVADDDKVAAFAKLADAFGVLADAATVANNGTAGVTATAAAVTAAGNAATAANNGNADDLAKAIADFATVADDLVKAADGLTDGWDSALGVLADAFGDIAYDFVNFDFASALGPAEHDYKLKELHFSKTMPAEKVFVDSDTVVGLFEKLSMADDFEKDKLSTYAALIGQIEGGYESLGTESGSEDDKTALLEIVKGATEIATKYSDAYATVAGAQKTAFEGEVTKTIQDYIDYAKAIVAIDAVALFDAAKSVYNYVDDQISDGGEVKEEFENLDNDQNSYLKDARTSVVDNVEGIALTISGTSIETLVDIYKKLMGKLDEQDESSVSVLQNALSSVGHLFNEYSKCLAAQAAGQFDLTRGAYGVDFCDFLSSHFELKYITNPSDLVVFAFMDNKKLDDEECGIKDVNISFSEREKIVTISWTLLVNTYKSTTDTYTDLSKFSIEELVPPDGFKPENSEPVNFEQDATDNKYKAKIENLFTGFDTVLKFRKIFPKSAVTFDATNTKGKIYLGTGQITSVETLVATSDDETVMAGYDANRLALAQELFKANDTRGCYFELYYGEDAPLGLVNSRNDELGDVTAEFYLTNANFTEYGEDIYFDVDVNIVGQESILQAVQYQNKKIEIKEHVDTYYFGAESHNFVTVTWYNNYPTGCTPPEGAVDADYKLLYGDEFIEEGDPEAPAGYEFKGWGETADATAAETFPDTVTKDLEYYAIWEPKS